MNPSTLSAARLVTILGIVSLSVLLIAPVAGAATAKTKRVSVITGGTQATGDSSGGTISATGRFIAFTSEATDLVNNDTNATSDVFIHDRKMKRTRRASIKSGGGQANDLSFIPKMSRDGRFVVFVSDATDLVAFDSNGNRDIFVHNRRKKRTRRVSLSSAGTQSNGDSSRPSISANGRHVAFNSVASDLIGSDTNGVSDVFVRDRKTKKTKRVSIRSGGGQANGLSSNPSISANGRYVVFLSSASDLVGNDTNGVKDVFIHDRKTKKTKRASIRSGGGQASGSSRGASVSDDGRFVAFSSNADDLVGFDSNGKEDVFVRDRFKKRTRRVSIRTGGGQGADDSFGASISGDGRYVVFTSAADELVNNDTNGFRDAFMHDRKKKKTKRISVKNGGGQGNGNSGGPSRSEDGRYIMFASDASNLISNDTNAVSDVFLRGPLR